MTNDTQKIEEFGARRRAPKKDEKALNERDGLFESKQLVTRKLVSNDGRQLLREQTHEVR